MRSIYLHCAPTASHYLKLRWTRSSRKAFGNEIVWYAEQHERFCNDVRDPDPVASPMKATIERFSYYIGNVPVIMGNNR